MLTDPVTDIKSDVFRIDFLSFKKKKEKRISEDTDYLKKRRTTLFRAARIACRLARNDLFPFARDWPRSFALCIVANRVSRVTLTG